MTLDEPLSTQAMLDEAMRQARRNFKAIYPSVGIPLALVAGLLPLGQGLWFRSLRFGGAGALAPGLPAMLVGMAAMIAVTLLFLIVYVIGYGAMLAAATEALYGRPVVMSRMWAAMVQPRALFTLVLSSMAIGAGSVCCLFPGIYVALIFSMIVPVMIEEKLFLADALGRSAALAAYNPRRSFGDDPRVRAFLVLFVGWLIGVAVSMVVQMPLAILQQVLLFRGVASGQSSDPIALMSSLVWLQVPSQAMAMAAQVAVHLYVSFGLALVYVDVRRRKEGQDLQSAVDAIGQRAPLDDPA